MQVLILEDHPIVAYMLSSSIKRDYNDAVVTITESFSKGISFMQGGLSADLLILDNSLPDSQSDHMVSVFRAVQPDVKILVYTGNEQYGTALAYLNAGVNGYLTKSQPIEEISVGIQTILDGERYVSREMKHIFADCFYELLNLGSPAAALEFSPREKEVLALLLDGKQTTQIAKELNLKLTTVSAHKTRIFEKFQVSNVIELYKKLKV